ncbi:hypothetical protein AVEN_31261-1 [Araneus ventricosus]|uniref:Uncharacterized protein n=1 Tax=Araneus ventricosus TaxID=182803 RepID=A0A4Y2W0Y6_ARAVE|nr:hypothetical protein AVEN_31261-1 [Araneus ventricosus]
MYQVSTPNKKELNQDNDARTAEIQSYRLKPDKSSHLPSNISINALQYVTTVVGEKEVKTLIDSGAQIPVINGKFLSQGKITTGKIILTSAFGERIEAGLAKFLVSLKSDHKDKFYRPIEILAAVSSRIQEQFIPNEYLSTTQELHRRWREKENRIITAKVSHTKNEWITKRIAKRRFRRIKEGNREAEGRLGKTTAAKNTVRK